MRQSTASTRRSRSVGWSRLHAQWERMYPGSDMEAVFGAGSVTSGKVGVFQRWAMRFTRGQDELSVAFRKSYPHTLFLRPDKSALPLELWGDVYMLVADANDVLRSQRSSGTNATASTIGWLGVAWMSRSPAGSSAPPARRFSVSTAVFLCGSSTRATLVRDRPRRGCRRKRHGGCNRPVDRGGHSRKTLSARSWPPPRRSIWFPFREQMMMWDATERVAIIRGGTDPSLRGGRSRSWWTCLSGQAGGKVPRPLRSGTHWRRGGRTQRVHGAATLGEFLEYLPAARQGGTR